MILPKHVKKYKKELIIGILVAFFIAFAELIRVATRPLFSAELTMKAGAPEVYSIVISLIVLAVLARLIEKSK